MDIQVKFIAHFESQINFYLAMEYCNFGDLIDFIMK